MRKIKWENILCIIFIIYSIVSMTQHEHNSLSILEMPVYLMLGTMLRIGIKSIRKGE